MYQLQSKLVWLLWWMLIAFIPLFSIYGRSLQYGLTQQISRQQLVLIFAVVLISMSLAAGISLVKRHGWQQAWHLTWFAALFVVVPFYVPLVEERIHFILFGTFGFLTLLIYPYLIGFVICIAVAGMDELLQYALPDRVGDWRDVMFNVLASSGGALFALVMKGR
ncbi:MAG TPA: VanZ family protein [Gammaproteobacteria bacterium]